MVETSREDLRLSLERLELEVETEAKDFDHIDELISAPNQNEEEDPIVINEPISENQIIKDLAYY